MKRSLKWQLVGWTAGGMLLILGIYAGLVHEVIEHTLKSNFGSALAGTARAIAASIRQDGTKIEIEFTEQETPEFHRSKDPDYFEVWADDGRVLRRSTSLGTRDLSRMDATADNPLVFHSVTLPDGRPGRAVAMIFRPQLDPANDAPTASQTVTLVVARGTSPLNAQLASLQWLVAVAAGATILLVLLVSVIVVRLGMRSINALAGRIAAIREDGLSDRVPTDALPDEMMPVAVRLNELLARLDAAFKRERTLTADVAHELRTPLAGMRSTIEVALSRPRSREEQTQALGECLDIVRQTQAMIDNLMALARIESGQVTPHPQTFILAETVETLWRPHQAAAEARGITFASHLEAGLECTVDRDLLAMALANILANAAEYADDGGRIDLSAGSRDGTVELVVSNTGCTLTAEQVTHVFDRFWRGDTSRTGTGVHCGLGLSLVERAVRTFGGRLTAATEDGRFVVRLAIPPAR
jgi:two-component system, OmpR family, heavy metal sensor histidine kinase CusS